MRTYDTPINLDAAANGGAVAASPEPHTVRLSETRVGIICALLAMTSALSLTLYIPALPDIVTAFQTDEFSVKLTVTSYFCAFALSQLFCGPLSDAFGRRTVIIAFASLTLLGAIIAVFAPSIELLILARAIQGLGAGVGNSTTRAVIRDLFAGQAAARVINLMTLMLGLGPTFGPIIGGALVSLWDWNAVLIASAVYAAIVLAVVVIWLPETNTLRTGKLNPKRIVGDYLSTLRDLRFSRPGLTVGFTAGMMGVFPAMLPFILIGQFHFGMLEFGLVMAIHAALYVAGAWITRLCLKRFEATKLVPIGLAGYVACGILLMVLAVVAASSPWSIFIPACGMTLLVPVTQPGLQSDAITPFRSIAGVVSSLLGFLQTFFAFLATTVASLFVDPSHGLATVALIMSLGATVVFVGLRRHTHSI